jgi:transcriptional regulator with XRE-family HTH domain
MKASIAQRIRQARLNSGLTQAELARRMGISRTSASIWESGGSVSQENLLRLAKVLKVAPEWLHYGVQRNEVDPKALSRCLAIVCAAKSKFERELDEEKLSRIVARMYSAAIRGVDISNDQFEEIVEEYL